MMRKASWWILILALVGLGLCWFTGQRQRANNPKCATGKAAVAAAAERVAPEADLAAGPAAAGIEVPVPGKRTAFRLVMDGDTVRLLATEELRGDFHQRRGRLAWLPGMLYFRLLDKQQRVVAEETLAAPDQACVVVNPHLAALEGKPSPAAVAATAPVVFQVRLPSVASATRLQVYRVTGPRPADTSAEPAARLLENLTLHP